MCEYIVTFLISQYINHRQSMHVCVNAGSSPLTGLSSGTHRLRIVPVGCSENRGKTIRFGV